MQQIHRGGEVMLDVFPGRLQKLRERRRMNRRALGEQCDLSKTSIRKYERGEAEPKATTIVRLAEIFDTSTDYLLGNTDYPGKYPK